MTQLKTIPALDTTPTGRALPFLVDEPSEHVEDPGQAARVEAAVDRIIGALVEHDRTHTAETLHQTLAREAAEREAGRPGRPCDAYDWCEEVDTHPGPARPRAGRSRGDRGGRSRRRAVRRDGLDGGGHAVHGVGQLPQTYGRDAGLLGGEVVAHEGHGGRGVRSKERTRNSGPEWSSPTSAMHANTRGSPYRP